MKILSLFISINTFSWIFWPVRLQITFSQVQWYCGEGVTFCPNVCPGLLVNWEGIQWATVVLEWVSFVSCFHHLHYILCYLTLCLHWQLRQINFSDFGQKGIRWISSFVLILIIRLSMYEKWGCLDTKASSR